jgi:hypothetical protein
MALQDDHAALENFHTELIFRKILLILLLLSHAQNSTFIIIIAQIFSSIPIYRLFRLRKTKQRGFRAQGTETRGAQGKDLL